MAIVTTPLITIIIRKSYAGAYYGMSDKASGADVAFAQPTGQITIVGEEVF